MTAQDLKNAILQLAVQGKLVPQDPTEGEADVRGIKQKPTEELDFDIPQTWKTAHIECISNTVPSKQFQILESEVRKTGRFPVISQSKEYTIGFTDVTDRVFHHDAPVIAFGDHTTEVKYITFDFVVGADGVKIFEPNTEIVFPQFLYYTLLYYTIGLNKVGGYSRHYKFIKNKPIPIPPLSEQQRIVAKIEELMPLVEEYGKAEERLTALNAEFPDKLRKSILQQAIQGKLTEREPADEPAFELLKRIRAEKERLVKEGKTKKEKPLPPITEEEMPFELPENWAWTRIGDVFEVNPRNNVLDETEVGFIPMPLLDPGFVNRHTFEKRLWKEVKKNFTHFQNGDVVFAKITPCFQNRKSAIMADLPNGYGAGTTELHVLRPFSGLVFNEYVLWFVKNERFILDGVEHFTGSVGQQRVATDYIKQYPFPLPPLAEQHRIVDRVNELLAVCDELK